MRALAAAVGALGVLFGTAGARAAGLNVSPVQIYLTPDASKALLTVRNDGADETRYQVSAFRWAEDASGMQLSPTQDVVFFPQLLTLKANETRNVRVGATVPFAGVEQTFRIFLEELPPTQRPQGPSAVRVLTRIGVPIFVAPRRAQPAHQLSAVKLAQGHASVDVQNTGNVHFRVEGVRLEGFAAGGAKLFERTLQGWYVLASGHKEYTLEVPKDGCAGVRRLVFSVKTDAGEQPWQAALDTPVGVCGS